MACCWSFNEPNPRKT